MEFQSIRESDKHLQNLNYEYIQQIFKYLEQNKPKKSSKKENSKTSRDTTIKIHNKTDVYLYFIKNNDT